MADDVTLPGTGELVAADERTIAAVLKKVQRVDEQGGTAIASAQVNVSSSAATLIAARDTRKSVLLINRQLASIFFGPATVTTANGVELQPGAAVVVPTTALIQAITAAASGATEYVHVLEVYDS